MKVKFTTTTMIVEMLFTNEYRFQVALLLSVQTAAPWSPWLKTRGAATQRTNR